MPSIIHAGRRSPSHEYPWSPGDKHTKRYSVLLTRPSRSYLPAPSRNDGRLLRRLDTIQHRQDSCPNTVQGIQISPCLWKRRFGRHKQNEADLGDTHIPGPCAENHFQTVTATLTIELEPVVRVERLGIRPEVWVMKMQERHLTDDCPWRNVPSFVLQCFRGCDAWLRHGEATGVPKALEDYRCQIRQVLQLGEGHTWTINGEHWLEFRAQSGKHLLIAEKVVGDEK